MGNFVSCGLPSGRQSSAGAAAAARVIFPGGEVRTFVGPTKAAELMLETPNHFLVDSRSMHAGRRLAPLNADEDLQMSQLYVLFPMKRVNSVVTAGDMGALFVAANRKRGSGGRGRILPECLDAGCARGDDATDESHVVLMDRAKRVDDDDHDRGAHRGDEDHENDDCGSLKLNLDDIEDIETKEFIHRLSMSRSKKPLLETIVEEPK